MNRSFYGVVRAAMDIITVDIITLERNLGSDLNYYITNICIYTDIPRNHGVKIFERYLRHRVYERDLSCIEQKRIIAALVKVGLDSEEWTSCLTIGQDYEIEPMFRREFLQSVYLKTTKQLSTIDDAKLHIAEFLL